jgi:exopolyphosphatase / guanosine-5'-triphosphate,3'-diphosphate pyrophosphatase
MIIGVIDIGTNQFHVLVARKIAAGQFQPLYRDDRLVRLGEGGINDGHITPQAMDRALTTLRDLRAVLDSYGCEKIVAIATSAVRNARNQAEFLALARQHAGLEVQVADGDTEAQLIYEGIRAVVPITQPALMMDIGGGSVEFILADATQMRWKQSHEIGTQRLLYRFHTVDPIPVDNVLKLNKFLAKTLAPVLAAAAEHRPVELIGSAGSLETIADIYARQHGRQLYDHSREFRLPAAGFQAVHRELLQKNRYERADIPGMPAHRRDMIVVASCLVDFMVRSLGFNDIRVCSASLLEGALARA